MSLFDHIQIFLTLFGSYSFLVILFRISCHTSMHCAPCVTNDVHGLQVFPLLLQQFSVMEQASLVWQFMCSIPLVLLEDLLPWMISSLQTDEKEEVIHCIKEIVPDEKYLQEVHS